MDLVEELERKNNELDQSIKMLRKNGVKLAEAERDYKIKLRQEALKLRADEGMAVTLINQIVYGIPEVAKLRFERDVAEAVYNANQEFINTTKLQIRILESQINREFGRAGRLSD